MNEATRQFRNSRIEIIAFIASEQQQKEFAKKVVYENYAEEFYEWWFEDWHPEDAIFRNAFSPNEIELLKDFSNTWESLDPQFCINMPINELLNNSAWVQTMNKAKVTLAGITNAT